MHPPGNKFLTIHALASNHTRRSSAYPVSNANVIYVLTRPCFLQDRAWAGCKLYTQASHRVVRRNIDQLIRRPPRASPHPWQSKQPARECPRDTKCPARGAPSSANFATHQHTTLSECAQPRTRMGLWHRTQQPRNDYDARTWGHKRVAGYQPHTHTCISRRAHQGTRQPHGRHAPASAQTTRRTTKRRNVPCA